jgi:hypothetical protein
MMTPHTTPEATSKSSVACIAGFPIAKSSGSQLVAQSVLLGGRGLWVHGWLELLRKMTIADVGGFYMSTYAPQLYEAVLIPFEISALNLVLTFWRDDIPVAAVVAACVVLYGIINLFAVRAYGETEFWLYALS